MKKIDLSQKVLTPYGKEVTSKVKVPYIKTDDNGDIIEENRFEAVTLTLGKALRDAVLASQDRLSVDEKISRFELFKKIIEDKEVELEDSEIDTIKQCVCDRYEIVYFGQIISLM